MKRAKQFYLAVIVVCIVIIVWSVYYTLGGFDPVEVFVMEGKERTVIGKEYIERYNREEWGSHILETKAAIDSGKLKGQLTIVYFDNKNIGKDSLHYFVGASVEEIRDVLRLPAGYDYREFRTSKVFKVFLTQHDLVKPSRDEVMSLMEVKAIEEGAVLQPLSFDLYYSDGSLSSEAWAR
ncbi:hypothetical protein [Ekhidna sp.]|uniref:hypothetical protein n=1 Tax=Ekhidna sp. TaxID=2608089 RepID=UPI00329979A7